MNEKARVELNHQDPGQASVRRLQPPRQRDHHPACPVIVERQADLQRVIAAGSLGEEVLPPGDRLGGPAVGPAHQPAGCIVDADRNGGQGRAAEMVLEHLVPVDRRVGSGDASEELADQQVGFLEGGDGVAFEHLRQRHGLAVSELP